MVRTREELIGEVRAERKTREQLVAEVGTEKQDALRRELDTILLDNGRIDELFLNQVSETSYLAPDKINFTLNNHPDPDEFRAKLANTFYLADAYGMTPQVAFNQHDTLVERLWGKGTSATNALGKIVKAKKGGQKALRRELTRKTIWQASKDAYSQMGLRMVKTVAGFVELAGYLNQKLTPWEVEFYDKEAEWGRMMSEATEKYYQLHPEEFIQARGDGFWDTTKAYLDNPVAIWQGMVEAVPMMLGAWLGHITGTAAAKAIGAAPKFLPWMGRVHGISVPIFGEEYAKLRDRNIDPKLAIPHAFLVAEGEGLVEEWVITRRIGMFKGGGRIAQKGMSEMAARMLWGGTKAYSRGLIEEMVQGANRNFWEIIFTDSDTKLLDGVFSEGAAGGLIELAMGGAFSAAGQVRRTGTQRLAPKEEKLARIEAVRNLMNQANLTPEQRTEINSECDRVREQVENNEYEKPAEKPKAIPVVPQNIKEEIEQVEPEEETKGIQPPEVTTMGGIAEEKVVPNLYIGNVTRRMKKKFAEIWERLPEEVKGFTEKGFPTKRTGFEMTRADATTYLNWLVEDLARRLEANEVRTENDLAWANADWGDIAALRISLGYTKGARPFKVIRAKKHIIKVIKNVKSRIWEAIRHPEPSGLTIRQVLNQVMKGMEKAARTAYIAGARETVKVHKDLARYAAEQLKVLDITKSQRTRLMKAIAGARTDAQRIVAIAVIDVLTEKANQAQAIKDLRKTVAYINKKIGKIMQEKGIRPEYLDKIKSVTDTLVFKKPTAKTGRRIASLKGYIDSLREAEMSKYERDFAEELIPKYLIRKLEKIELKPVAKMSAEEITDINNELRELIHLNETKNKIILEQVKRNAADILNGALAELDNVIDKSVVPEDRTLATDFQNNSIARKVIGWTATTKNHDLETLIDTITGGQKGVAFEAVVELFSHGRGLRDAYLGEAGDYMIKVMENNNITLEDLQRMSPGFQRLFKAEKVKPIRELFVSIFGGVATPLHKVKTAGQVISLTKAELMSIYMHAQARYNFKAMLKEGVASYKTRIGVMTGDELAKIATLIESDPKAKILCDAAAHVYSTMSRDAINGTSMDLKGIELADEPHYWHIERFTTGGIAGAETFRLSLLESEGRIQPRTGSKSPIIIRDFFECFFNDRQAVAEYVGMSKAYRAAKMLFNYKPYREKIKGLGYAEELNNLGTIIRNTEQHPYDRAPIDSVIMRILRGTVRAVLAEPGIWLGQFVSTRGYFNEVSERYMTKVIPPSQAEIERYKKHWSRFKQRAEGGVSSIALQDISQNDMALRMFTGKVDYMSLLTTMIHRVDIRAVGVAGKITEAEMADRNQVGRTKEYWDRQPVNLAELEFESEEYWDAFRKRAQYLVRRTQPMFDGENRSVHTGVTAPSRKMWFLFRSYIDQPLRMAYREHTARQNNRISKGEFIAKLANVWVTLASYGILQWLVARTLYRSDDDWADLIYDIMAAPIKILTIVGYPIKVLLERIIDVKREKRPAFYKPKMDTVAISIVNRTIDATTRIADGLGYLGSNERYQSGPHEGELKSHQKLQEGMLMQIENIAALFGIPAGKVRRAYKGWTREEEPISTRD